MSPKARPTVQAVERAIAILKAFSSEEPELGVGELSRRLNLPKSTVFRLLATLEAGGLVAQDPRTGRYRLGVDLIGLANNVIDYADLRRVARPYLRQLAEDVGETVSLSILDGEDAVNLDQYVPAHRFVMRAGWIGRRMPAHAVSVGKVLVAFLPEEQVEAFLQTHRPTFTSHTITDPAALRAELAQVRAQGYATAFEELEEGLHAVSAPVRNHEGDVVAAISVSGPGYRLTRERVAAMLPRVVETAQLISREMGAPAEEERG
ncbi:MAG: IclR family transcriptional regulator [Ardenticatenia bacterium]|nr:IclR family transcriptional regulator [Ardenticatenia bacterium]